MVSMIYLFIVESALELVPKKLWSHPSIINDAKRRGTEPSRMLLNISKHFHAMKNLRGLWKRGRPDIIHLSLLTALDSPINKAGKLRVYVHTVNDLIIEVNPEVRLPRSYERFEGLIVQLLNEGRVPLKGRCLMRIIDVNLDKLIDELRIDTRIGLSRRGRLVNLQDYLGEIELNKICVFVGGFPRGTFSNKILKLITDLIAISRYPLSTHLTICKFLSEVEQALGIL